MTIPTNRKASSPRILSVRPLTEADLEYLRQPSAAGRVARLRDSHHNIARLAALGLSNYEIAERTGYSYGRVAVLIHDPAIEDLIAQYRKRIDDSFVEHADLVTTEGVKVIAKYMRHVNDHFDEADEKGELLPISSLAKIGPDLMDRFGYGKKSMNVNVNVDFAAKLESAIARSRKVAAE